MKHRPDRWWDSKRGVDKHARIDAIIDQAHDPNGGTVVCPCHGRLFIWHSWAGLTKRSRG